MWISRKRYEELITELSQQKERVLQLEIRLKHKGDERDCLRIERDELREDLRKVFGLKKIEKPAPAPAPTIAPEDDLLRIQEASRPFKMRESPREAVERLQRERDRQAQLQEMKEINAAIAQYENVLLKQ